MNNQYETCSICLNEFSSVESSCPYCGVEREPGGEIRSELQDGREITWAIVRTVNTVVEAEIIAGRLRVEGIPAIVLSQVDSTRNLTVGALAIAKVFVPTVLLVEAESQLDLGEGNQEDDDLDSEGAE